MKIAICTPVHGDTRAGYTFSLAAMIIETMKKRSDLDLRIFSASCSNVAVGRQNLVDMAIDAEADWILWIDSDHDFPPGALLRLLSLNEPFVGCNQSRRETEARPCAGFTLTDFAWTTPEKVQRGEIETVEWIGLAFALVSMRALREASPPLFTGIEEEGEDVTFCVRMKAAGFPPKVDHRLSASVGHIGLKRYTTADSLKQRQIREINADMERRRQERAIVHKA